MDLPANPSLEDLHQLQKYLEFQKKEQKKGSYGQRNYYVDEEWIIPKKVKIFKHPQNGLRYYMRMKISNPGNPYKTISLRTLDRDIAHERALEKWRSLQNLIDGGGSVFEKSINEQIDCYIKHLEDCVNFGSEGKSLKKITFRSKMTSIRKLKIFLDSFQKLSAVPNLYFKQTYIKWRRTKNWDKSKHKNNLNPPTDLTINKELSDFKGFLDWALERKVIAEEFPLPFIEINWRKAEKKNPAFEVEDWNHISKYLQWWVRGSIPNNRKHNFYRKVFFLYIMILVNSGMRPHEALKLKWGDILLKKKIIKDWTQMGTQHHLFPRIDKVVAPPGGETMLSTTLHDKQRDSYIDFKKKDDQIYSRRMQMIAHIQISHDTKTGSRFIAMKGGLHFKKLKDHYNDHKFTTSPDEYIFRNVGTFNSRRDDFVGGALSDSFLRKLWYEFVDYCQKANDFQFKKKYTIYSCRSFFINEMLLMGHEPHIVAKLVGHSIKVMDRHYEEIKMMRLSDQLVEVRKKNLSSQDFTPFEVDEMDSAFPRV